MWPLISVVLTAVVLRVVAAMTSTLEVASWGAAFLAAIIMMAAGWLIGFVVVPLLALEGVWQIAGFLFILNTVMVALIALMLPGMALRGFLGLLLAGSLLTVVDFLPRLRMLALS